MYVTVSSLPMTVASALNRVNYGRKDIEVIHAESVSLSISGGSGKKGFVLLVDIANNRHELHQGSWGGANMFNTDNVVDLDNTPKPLLPGMLVIRGTFGGSDPTWAQIYAHRDSSILPLESGETLEPAQLKVLAVFSSIRSGCRKEYLDRIPTSAAITDKLVEMGHLKRNKAGATQITTSGKNLAHGVNYW